jgi:hypothetical protein
VKMYRVRSQRVSSSLERSLHCPIVLSPINDGYVSD